MHILVTSRFGNPEIAEAQNFCVDPERRTQTFSDVRKVKFSISNTYAKSANIGLITETIGVSGFDLLNITLKLYRQVWQNESN